jgi:hypothetical protein
MRYYLKCKLNPVEKDRLAKGIKYGSLANGKIFYEGMQSALRNATIDEDGVVHFVNCSRNYCSLSSEPVFYICKHKPGKCGGNLFKTNTIIT